MITDSLLTAVRASGLNQLNVSQQTGVSRAVLSRWLSGKRTITLETADRIAKGLGLVVTMAKAK